MIIMQTHFPTALARLQHIQTNNLAKPIFTQFTDEADMVQYHPKGIPGGIMPELDSHRPDPEHPDPLGQRFSPWHAAGPKERYAAYKEGMRRAGNLRLVEVVLRLKDEDQDVKGATRKWEEIFGVRRGEKGDELEFTNARLRFCEGVEGRSEGLVEVSITVEGRGKRDEILARARTEGLHVEGEVVEMLGVRWKFTMYGAKGQVENSKL